MVRSAVLLLAVHRLTREVSMCVVYQLVSVCYLIVKTQKCMLRHVFLYWSRNFLCSQLLKCWMCTDWQKVSKWVVCSFLFSWCFAILFFSFFRFRTCVLHIWGTTVCCRRNLWLQWLPRHMWMRGSRWDGGCQLYFHWMCYLGKHWQKMWVFARFVNKTIEVNCFLPWVEHPFI